jgi:glycerol-3-phosphate responsive antiterminator
MPILAGVFLRKPAQVKHALDAGATAVTIPNREYKNKYAKVL